MVASNQDCAGLPDDVEHTERVRTARKDIANESKPVAARERNAIEQGFELGSAAVHVANDDGAAGQSRRRSKSPHGFVVELGALGYDDDAVFRHEKPLAIGLEIEADLDTCRHLDAFVDDAPANFCVPTNANALEKYAFFDLAEGVDAAANRQHTSVNAPARDDAAVADHGIGGDTNARVGFVAEHELRRRIVRHAGANGPALVIQIEQRVDPNEVHLRFPISLDGADVAPVAERALFLARHAIFGKIVSEDVLAVGHHTRQNIVAEVVLARLDAGVAIEFVNEIVAAKNVIAHRRKAHVVRPRHGWRVFHFFVEPDDAPFEVGFDDAEVACFVARHGNGRNGGSSTTRDVRVDHLANIHFVDVVAAEDAHDFRALVSDDVLALENGVGRAFEPRKACALLGRNGLDELIENGRQSPDAGDVLFERRAFVLREDFDARKTRVDEIRQHDVDDAIAASKRHGGLRAVEGERIKALALATGENHYEHLVRIETGPLSLHDLAEPE